jgi:serine/threonine protein kinase
MTGFTGAVRYMAPEVGLRKPYNLKADVYSWSMIMWYIMALEPPMGFYTPSMFVDRVFRKGHRPVLKDKWPDSLKKIMKQCWSENIAGRPDFTEILMTIRQEAQAQDPHTLDFLLADAGSGRSRSSTASNRKR